MTNSPVATISPDALARVYIEALATAEGVKVKSKFPQRYENDPVAHLLNELEPEEDDDTPRLRPDTVAIAALLAKAIADEPGLASELRKGSPVVSISTGTSDLVDHVRSVIASIGGSRSLIVARDGSERHHVPEKGNMDVVTALSRRRPVIGIASDPARQLPRTLQQMSNFRLMLPALDEWALNLVLEFVTGRRFEGEIDRELVMSVDVNDLPLALRYDRTPEDCLERLKSAVQARREHAHDGPFLEDLDGYGAAKEWGLRLVGDIRDYKSGRIGWKDVEGQGLLLSGSPGVGKTTFAKALAKSANVSLVATSVADWNAASYLSGTLQAMRDAFGQAIRTAPSILFIDELDGISNRESLGGDYKEYWSQIVNLLLQLLAGTDERRGVVVIGASNYPDVIDPAIRRSGRLDKEIRIEKPDADALVKIFRHHLGIDVLAGVELMPLALAARGATGADVESWSRRARAAARRQGRPMTLDDMLDQVRDGRPAMTAAQRNRVAIHEMGHVLVSRELDVGELSGVSIYDGGGVTEIVHLVSGATTESELENLLVMLMGGRAAENVVLGDIGVGSGSTSDSDLGRATNIALTLETCSGLGELGHVLVPTEAGELHRHPWLLQPVRVRLNRAFTRAHELLSAKRGLLDTLAKELNARSYLSADEIEKAAAAFREADTPSGPFTDLVGATEASIAAQ